MLEPIPGIEAVAGSLDVLTAFRKSWRGARLPDAFCADLIYGLDRFCLGYCEGTIANITWFTPNRWTFNARHEAGDWELRDVLTLRSFRGQGIAPIVLQTILQILKTEAASRVFAHVEKGNQTSEKMLTKVGLQRIGKLRRTRIMGFEKLTRLNGEP